MTAPPYTLSELVTRYSLEDLRVAYIRIIEDTANTDTAIRESARRVLTEHEVEGDQYQVPSVEHIVELLVGKIEELSKKKP
jgi:hypothetical protein